mmetsp:Transcript_55167/g.81015  ORF Transcript_55167/g.81015 Transcript_55167/m.81015 type:complete len:226 (+) Transcript_55167:76-753(+)
MQLNRRVAANAPVLPVMQMDEKERRRRAMMGGAKGAMSATVSTMQTTGSKSSMNGENDTMQMMRQAVRQKMIASASMKKLVVEAGDVTETQAAPAAAADPRAAFKKRSFSLSMPAHIMRKDIESLSAGGDTKAMGNIIKGLDALSDQQSMNALRYIQFTCEQLGLDAESLPCAQKVISAEAKLKGTYNIVEEEEEELSVDDMLADGSSCVASEIATLSRHISSPV